MASQPNHSLIDGLACLQALASSKEPVGSRPLARELGLDPMRVNRLLKTMAEIGLAQQDEKKKYCIGPGIHALAAQSIFGSGLLQSILPLIREIPYRGILVAVGVLWRDKVTYLYHGRVGANVDAGIGKMGLHPALSSSIGLVLLSEKTDLEIAETVGDDLKPFESMDSLNSAIADARERGYSEIVTITRNIAVSIGGRSGAAIALSGIPSADDVEPYLDQLLNIREQLAL